MTAVIVGMLLVVIAAVVVLAVVAVPQLREGRRVLTPQGRDQVSEARRRAAGMASQARRAAGDVADQAGQAGQKAAARRAEKQQASQQEPAAVDLREAPAPGPARPSVPRPVPTRPRTRSAERSLSWEHLEPGPRHARG